MLVLTARFDGWGGNPGNLIVDFWELLRPLKTSSLGGREGHNLAKTTPSMTCDGWIVLDMDLSMTSTNTRTHCRGG